MSRTMLLLAALGIVALSSTSCLRGGFVPRGPGTDAAVDVQSDRAGDVREETSWDLWVDAVQDVLEDASRDQGKDLSSDLSVDQISWQRTTFVLDIDAKANIYGAGHTPPPGGGLMPPVVKLPAGTQRFFRLTKVTGTIAFFAGDDHGADGTTATNSYDSFSYGGLAGPQRITSRNFFSAVFVDGSEPVDPAPAGLDIGDGTFHEISPVLRQIFFAGDGLDGATPGARQVFWIPPGATRLFWGFMDGLPGGTAPSSYADNQGSLHVEGEILLVMNGGG